jgi:alkanesulfonate monooxygenase SsuD/methylene tetrahydromethanopterin reductase-like flavin-dependent oxidoreductase (luciferase family)
MPLKAYKYKKKDDYMKYGFILMGDAAEIVELAQEAERAGWDGVFLPDDWMAAWIKLTAIAMRTQRIHLGTMLTPLPEQLPWYVADTVAKFIWLLV